MIILSDQSFSKIVELLLDMNNSISLKDVLFSIIPSLFVGICLATLSFYFDKKKQKQIDVVSKKTTDLLAKIDSQKILIDKINSIEIQNRINCMNTAKTLYSKVYTIYWNRLSLSPDFNNLFEDAKKYMFENSIFLNDKIRDAFFTVFKKITVFTVKDPTINISNAISEFDDSIESLKKCLITEYNLLGIITKYEIEET